MMPFALIDGASSSSLRVVHIEARLLLVGRQQIDVDFDWSRSRGLRRIWNQRAETFAECGGVVIEHVVLLYAARRASSSLARATYAAAPRDFASYSTPGIPWLGASPSRTLRGMIVLKTFSLKNSRTSRATD